MSTYQGQCGACNTSGDCAGAPVLPTDTAQLSSGMRTGLLTDATVFNHQLATGRTQFASAGEYLRYKKARTLTGSLQYGGWRGAQSVIIKNLNEAGCP